MATNPSTGNVSAPSLSPDPIRVKKNPNVSGGANDGVQWTLNDKDWTFTGVDIDHISYAPGTTPPNTDFSNLHIMDDKNGKSVMTIDDANSEVNRPGDTLGHKYTLYMAQRNGPQVARIDPIIRNEWD